MSWLNLLSAVCLFAGVIVIALSLRGQKKNARQIVLLVILLATACVQGYLALPKSPRPQLDVKNVSTRSVFLRHSTGELELTPGGTGAFRYSPGDDFTIFAGGDASGKSKTVTLPAPAEEGQSRVTAEVNADDAAQIGFRVRK